jgi:hypothetical protein
MTATVIVSPGAPDRACCTLFPNSSLTSSAASSPHGCPGPSTPFTNARATHARSARPATVTLSRTAGPAISTPAFPGRPRPGNLRGTAAGHTGMHAPLNGARQAGMRRQHGRTVNPAASGGIWPVQVGRGRACRWLACASIAYFLRSRDQEANRAQGVIRKCFPYPGTAGDTGHHRRLARRDRHFHQCHRPCIIPPASCTTRLR